MVGFAERVAGWGTRWREDFARIGWNSRENLVKNWEKSRRKRYFFSSRDAFSSQSYGISAPFC